MKANTINITNANGNKAVNQFIINKGNILYFQSYNTIVAKYNINKDKLILDHYTSAKDENGKYVLSRTTARYLYRFVNNYCSGATILNSVIDVRKYNKENKTTNLNK